MKIPESKYFTHVQGTWFRDAAGDIFDASHGWTIAGPVELYHERAEEVFTAGFLIGSRISATQIKIDTRIPYMDNHSRGTSTNNPDSIIEGARLDLVKILDWAKNEWTI